MNRSSSLRGMQGYSARPAETPRSFPFDKHRMMVLWESLQTSAASVVVRSRLLIPLSLLMLLAIPIPASLFPEFLSCLNRSSARLDANFVANRPRDRWPLAQRSYIPLSE